jgi:hypothetical protein
LALISAVSLAVAAVVFAATGAFLVWVPFSSDPPDTAASVLVAVGCAQLAVALVCAWGARRVFRSASSEAS